MGEPGSQVVPSPDVPGRGWSCRQQSRQTSPEPIQTLCQRFLKPGVLKHSQGLFPGAVTLYMLGWEGEETEATTHQFRKVHTACQSSFPSPHALGARMGWPWQNPPVACRQCATTGLQQIALPRPASWKNQHSVPAMRMDIWPVSFSSRLAPGSPACEGNALRSHQIQGCRQRALPQAQLYHAPEGLSQAAACQERGQSNSKEKSCSSPIFRAISVPP